MTFLFRRKNILPVMLLLSVVGIVVMCSGMGSPSAPSEEIQRLTRALDASKSEVNSLYFWLVVVVAGGVILGIVMWLWGINLGFTADKESKKAEKRKGGRCEQDAESD